MSKNVISDIEEVIDFLIIDFKIPYSIDELVDNFNKIYYSFDTKRKRLKIVGNQHRREFDKKENKIIVKQKKVQIFLLKQHTLDTMNNNSFKEMYEDVIKFCFYIELLKMNKTIENKDTILREKYSAINNEEIQDFMDEE